MLLAKMCLCVVCLLLKVDHLIGWVKNSFASLAMVDYPYPASYLAPLPAYPINVSCQTLLAAQDMLTGLADAAGWRVVIMSMGVTGESQDYYIFEPILVNLLHMYTVPPR